LDTVQAVIKRGEVEAVVSSYLGNRQTAVVTRGGGVLPIIALPERLCPKRLCPKRLCPKRLCPKGVPFSGFRYIKG